MAPTIILTDPSPVQVDGYEGRWNGEVIHEGVELQHEPELVWGSDEPDEEVEDDGHIECEPDEEVDHEEDIESKVDLLENVLVPWNTLLDTFRAGCVDEVNPEREQGEDEDKCNLANTNYNIEISVKLFS